MLRRCTEGSVPGEVPLSASGLSNYWTVAPSRPQPPCQRSTAGACASYVI